MKNNESSLNLRMMSYGSYLKSLRKSMIIIKMNSIRKLEMKWMNGQDLLIDMAQSLRNLNWFALFVVKI